MNVLECEMGKMELFVNANIWLSCDLHNFKMAEPIVMPSCNCNAKQKNCGNNDSHGWIVFTFCCRWGSSVKWTAKHENVIFKNWPWLRLKRLNTCGKREKLNWPNIAPFSDQLDVAPRFPFSSGTKSGVSPLRRIFYRHLWRKLHQILPNLFSELTGIIGQSSGRNCWLTDVGMDNACVMHRRSFEVYDKTVLC